MDDVCRQWNRDSATRYPAETEWMEVPVTVPAQISQGPLNAAGEGQVQSDQNFPVVPVKVVFDENEQIPPEFAAWSTWPIQVAGNGQATQLCPRRYHRYKAKMTVTIPTGGATVTIANKPDPLSTSNPQGWQLTYTAGIFTLPEYDAQQPVYAVASVAGVIISVLDESYGTVT